MRKDLSHLKVALIHDYLREYGGAERVLETLHTMFPHAPVYTAFVDKESLGKHWERFSSWKIVESPAAKIPFIHSNILFSPLRILSAYFFESFDFSDFDVVISSTNMYMAKAVLTGPHTLHISYIHTPPRSLYGYTTRSNWKGNPLTHFVGNLINFRMRTIDYLTAQRPDVLVANSKEVQRRIQKFYHRDSVLIYPPVSAAFEKGSNRLASAEHSEYFLYVGRITRSKHVDLAIQAAIATNKKLKIVGTGKGEDYLRGISDRHIEFLGSVSDSELSQLYSQARAVIFPAEDEDFGIVPVEAQIHGIPVIAHKSGGSLETVLEGETGIFFKDLTVESLTEAIHSFERMSFDSKKIFANAQQFSASQFIQKMSTLIEEQSKTFLFQ